MTSLKTFFFFAFQCFGYMYGWNMMKNIHSPLGGDWYMGGPRYGLVPNSYEPGQLTLISVGLIRYSCCHILGHHEPIHVKFGV